LAPVNSYVCDECAQAYERMVAEGTIQDYVNVNEPPVPEPDDDGDHLDRKFTRF
jgi:hypothetical protein